MAFTPKTWADRAVEFAGRRLLTAVAGIADTFTVTRAEGTVFVAGDEIDATNLNDLEARIKTETDLLEVEISNLGTATLLATCTSTTFSAFTITDIDTYRYIGMELTNGAGACLHYTQMPVSIFKTKNSTAKTLASEYNAQQYASVYYSSDTQIYASTTSGATYPLLIYGIK